MISPPAIETMFPHTIQRALSVNHMIAWEWNLVTGIFKRSRPALHDFGIDADAPMEEFVKLVLAEDRETVEQTLRRARETSDPCFAHFRLVLPNGELVWVEAIGSGKHDAQGRCVAIVGTLLNISDRKQDEQRLRETQQLPNQAGAVRQPHEAESAATEKQRLQLLASALDAGEAQMAMVHRCVATSVARIELLAVLAPVFSAVVRQTLLQAMLPICEQVASSGLAIQLTRDVPAAQLSDSLQAVMTHCRIGALYCQPLRTGDGPCVGVLTTLWCASNAHSAEQLLRLAEAAHKLAELQPVKATPPLARRLHGKARLAQLQLAGLSPQQQRIAELLATAHSNRAVATLLQISENTVKAHVATILRRLGLRSRVQLVVLKHSAPSIPAAAVSENDDQELAGG